MAGSPASHASARTRAASWSLCLLMFLIVEVRVPCCALQSIANLADLDEDAHRDRRGDVALSGNGSPGTGVGEFGADAPVALLLLLRRREAGLGAHSHAPVPAPAQQMPMVQIDEAPLYAASVRASLDPNSFVQSANSFSGYRDNPGLSSSGGVDEGLEDDAVDLRAAKRQVRYHQCYFNPISCFG